jgi:hypothetical protein
LIAWSQHKVHLLTGICYNGVVSIKNTVEGFSNSNCYDKHCDEIFKVDLWYLKFKKVIKKAILNFKLKIEKHYYCIILIEYITKPKYKQLRCEKQVQSPLDNFSWFWLTSFSWFSWSQRLLNYLIFFRFEFDCTWRRLFQKSDMHGFRYLRFLRPLLLCIF